MSLIVQLLAAGEAPEAPFHGDEGIRLDAGADFVLPADEMVLESFCIEEMVQTSRTTTGAPSVNPDVMNVRGWTFSFTPKRILIRSPYAIDRFGSVCRADGFASGGYLRYEDIASVNAANYSVHRRSEGRIEIESKGNTQKSGMQITTIVRSESAEVIEGFARALAERLRVWWAGKADDAEAFGKRMDEFAGLDWQAVIDDKGYLRGIGIYKYEDGTVGARWREELPISPVGIDAVKRTVHELKEDAKRTAAFLAGRTYRAPKKVRYRGEE